MILTPTSERNLNNLRIALDSSIAVLIQGDIGCGKSYLANTLATSYGAKDTMIHMSIDDSFDSKDLLGKFSATETPGVFEWIPGPLTSAVENGYWILAEDIDLASFDVFSVLLSLLEESTLFIPDKNKRIYAHPNFKIIATQQLRAVGDALITRRSNSIPFAELWGTVVMESLPPEEISTIATTLYQVPRSIVHSLATLPSTQPESALVTMRCLLKWCKRVERRLSGANLSDGFVSSTLRELMFREAFDCVLAAYPADSDRARTTMALLADSLDILPNVAESLVNGSKPDMTLAKEYFTIGRVALPRFSALRSERESYIAFAPTRHAMSLLERIAVAVEARENVLLTGETGVGKTFIVQYLADQIGQKLIVQNLNQQTDASDFMGGWKPLDLGVAVRDAYRRFVELFAQVFNAARNVQFLDTLQAAVRKSLWLPVVKQILKGCNSFRLKNAHQSFTGDLAEEWAALEGTALDLLNALEATKTTFAFQFEEGSLAKAWREGSWILLDELNLATNEILERVSSVLGDVDALFLTDRGNCEAIKRHENFHVFANMNPPTDVGKKDLPPALRSKFTELYVNEPFDRNDINIMVREYIGHLAADCKSEEITTFFLECVGKSRSSLCTLDGEAKPPSFSLRTLTRALSYVRKATAQYGFSLALFDGLMLGFATPLQRQFHSVVEQLITTSIFGGKQPPHPVLPHCPSESTCVAYEHIWLPMGSEELREDASFILTPSVRGHLLNVARAVFADRPVLLEGPTSSGKSSMVKYLAERTGHKFVRINNHESTEIQEYLGHYVSDERGKLRFVDGILVDAVRNGYWVVLDELNLAPTDVLEALNRILDDNRELFVADTQETIKPHPQLRIFATQNPAGVYGGRKLLSRAFRNRFLEITVDDIPTTELTSILCQRYSLCTSFAEKMVEIMISLQLRRQVSQVFAGRHGFITPRDLFRWAERRPRTYQEMAEHGFLLLAERCRKDEERQIVKDVVESITRTEVNRDLVYSPHHWPYIAEYYNLLESGLVDEFRIVWTKSMRRLFTLVGISLHHKEPVLLVGETGSSKTTVCQLWAALLKRRLSIVNCHQHSEAADFLGSLRPALPDERRKALFEWRNGPLVECMLEGSIFVLDEISLAEHSVLERLNSVLEPSRVVTLAEKSTADVIYAHENFRILATMNPGGDFGKKELSPALRNRFTEIYVRPTTDEEEVTLILSKRLAPSLEPWAGKMASILCDVAKSTTISGALQHISIRDVVGWASFMNAANGHCEEGVAFMHGLDAVILDGIGVGTGQMEFGASGLRDIFLAKAKEVSCVNESCLQIPFWELFDTMEEPRLPSEMGQRFFFGAPSTCRSLSKLIRATIMRKAVLLEGSPGVGKTSIVEALGCALGKHVVRINLSEQTDIMDLFGSYLPCPSTGDVKSGPQFSWSDGVLLQALKIGWWVILDELNLASQAVLEGLNALLDHRSAVFIPELGEEFHAADEFRVFACQNPVGEGCGRKGLPRSFLNRFTRVRIEPFVVEDLMSIALAMHKNIHMTVLEKMVHFVGELHSDVMLRRAYGIRGSPWEFNLRDVLRWAKLMETYNAIDRPCEFVEMLFVQRMRTDVDRDKVMALAKKHFGDAVVETCRTKESDFLIINDTVCYGGSFLANRMQKPVTSIDPVAAPLLLLLPSQADVIRSVLMCAEKNQFCLLVGPSGAGKTLCLRTAAALVGARLVTFSMNASCDTVDLLGGFDQVEGKQGQFEWRDSIILSAMQSGDWLVLDNVNYCNASVLDRLNPLVEPNGVLSVNEQGLVDGHVRVVCPHPNFRLFATLDPKYGEISRAMRNRAVELYVGYLRIPSLESIAVAGAASPCRNVALLDTLTRCHREFLLNGFQADSSEPMSAQLFDALAAGSPNTFTLVKTSRMLLSGATWEDLHSCILHRYIQNRCGHWSARKKEVVVALETVISNGRDREYRMCCPSVTDLLDAMSLGTGEMAEEMAESDRIEAALVRIRVHRSGLAIKTMVSNGDFAASNQYSARGLVLFFVMEQSADTAASEILTALRKEFASCTLANLLLTEAEINETMPLFSSHYQSSSSTHLDTLWCRAMQVLGPHAAWLRILRDTHVLFSDSPVLNACLHRLLTMLADLADFTSSPVLQQWVCRYLSPLMHLLCWSNPTFKVNTENFVSLVTSVALLRSLLKKQTLLRVDELLGGIDDFLESLRRYLDLPYPLIAERSAVQRSIVRPHITTVDERTALAAWKAAADAILPEEHEGLLKALWHTAIFRAEFSLVQLVHRGRNRCSKAFSPSLHSDVRQFVDLYCTRLHVLSELEVTLWKELLSLGLQESPDGGSLAALAPLLFTHFISRHGLSGGRHILHGSWIGAAHEALTYAAEASVMSIATESSAHAKTLAGVLSFCRVLPVLGMKLFESWEANSMEDLQSMLTLCCSSERVWNRQEKDDEEKEEEAPCVLPSLSPSLSMVDVVHDVLRRFCANPVIGAMRPLLQMVTEVANEMGGTPIESLRRVALVGALRSRLLLPSSPIDYMHKWLVKKATASEELSSLSCLEKAFRWSEELSMRTRGSPQRHLLHDLQAMEEANLVKASRKCVTRPDASGTRFAHLVGVLHQICATMLSNDRLAAALQDGRLEACTARRTWSDLLYQQFTDVLENFGGYEDVTLAMAEPAFFAALAAHVSSLLQTPLHNVGALFSMSDSVRMMQFPLVALAPSIALPSSSTHSLNHRLMFLDSCLTFVQSTPARVLKRDFVDNLFALYRDLYRVVEELEEKERREHEMAVLYSEKTITVEGDDEKHLRALKELFPSYEEEFLKMRDAEIDHTTPTTSNNASAAAAAAAAAAPPLHDGAPQPRLDRAGRHTRIMLSGPQGARYVRHLIDTHHQFFFHLLTLHDCSPFDGEKALQAFKSRFDVLARELHRFGCDAMSENGIMPMVKNEHLLLGGFAARTALLSKELLLTGTSLEEEEKKRAMGFNIFTDPAPLELRSFGASLRLLIQAVEELRATYVDTPSLHRCSRIAAGIAALPALTTPLMKIMAGCEVLLRECYEWERNASRDTSILKHITQLSSFVLRWRRLELHCWSQVFMAKREEWELKAGMAWFKIFDLIDGGRPIPAEMLQERCLALFAFCMEFMWGANYGDFHVRLRLLKAFGSHLVASAPSVSSPLANTAMHLADFFSQFSQLVSDKLRLALSPLEEDMEAFTRIMRWEDATYYAVRSTAEKSHLKMGRALAELDVVLRTPVLGMISSEESRCEEDAAMGFLLPSVDLKGKKKKKLGRNGRENNNNNNDNSSSNVGVSGVVSKRRRSEKKNSLEAPAAHRLGINKGNDSDDEEVEVEETRGSVARGVEFLRFAEAEIIERVKALQAPGVPQSQKVRGLKMLFEVMGEKGVPHTHENRVSCWEELFSSTSALLAGRSIHRHLAVTQQAEEAAIGYYRSARWLQRMRDAECHPHRDLSDAQVKRGTGIVESLFTLSVKETELVGALFEVQNQVTLLQECVVACRDCMVPCGGEVLQTSLEICVQLQCFLHNTKWLLQERVFELEDVRGTLEKLCCATEDLWRLCLRSEAHRRTEAPVADTVVQQHAVLHGRLLQLCMELSNTGVGCIDASASALCASFEMAGAYSSDADAATMIQVKRARVEKDTDWLKSVQELLDVLESTYADNNVVLTAAVAAADNDGDGGNYGAASAGERVMQEQDGIDGAAVYRDYATRMCLLLQETRCVTLSLHAVLQNAAMGQQMSMALRHELAMRLERISVRIATVLQETVGALEAQSRLGLVLSRLFCILLRKGFCKSDTNDEDNDDNDGDGGDGGQQDGTGMDDGHGEKDVTDQIDNEDQLMNMKDKEEQDEEQQQKQQQQREEDEEDEDHAADVETDFNAAKEERKEQDQGDDGDDDDEDGGSEEEMGSVDGEDAREKKRMKKDKNDGNDMESDDGGGAEEVPEDTFVNEEGVSEMNDDDEETGNFENREAALREAERRMQEGEHELAADGIEDEEGDGCNDEDEDEDDGSSSTDGNEDEAKGDEGENGRDGDGSKEQEDVSMDAPKDSHGAQEEDTAQIDDNGDEEGESTASGSSDEVDCPDGNVFHGGIQDDHTGEENTKRRQPKDGDDGDDGDDDDNDDDKRPNAAHQQEAAGAEEQQQPGDEQRPDDAGRNWKRQEQNESSRHRDNTERSATSRNPYRAIKEALQRHERQVQQLNLNQRVEVAKQRMSEQQERDATREEWDDAIDEFEFDENGEREGMAATDEKPAPPTEAECNLQEPEEGRCSASESEMAEEDVLMRRRTRAADMALDMDSDDDDDAARRECTDRRRARVTAKAAHKEEEEEEDCGTEDEQKQEQSTAANDESEKLCRGRRLWQDQAVAVQGLSHHLCEQLRLILAPTLADKLQGDYKTGKRLNMKRIIPYIASQFKKDRIWLRRTKPNKRSYQVLVALDDSLSMHCNNAGVMSCRAVTLLAEALRELEVGEFGIACFGRETHILHGLEEPFTLDSGPRAFSEITFAQKSTNLRLLLQSSLDYLDTARDRMLGQSRSTNQQLQQIMFIISDGQITEDRAELRKLLLRAEENHQIVVFVLLDVKAATPAISAVEGGEEVASAPLAAKDLVGLTPAERMRRLKAEREARLHRVQSNSVLDMQLVEFRGGNVVRRSYMQEFPFPYYLIVRELETLPRAIADAMRQWFELLNVQHY